MLNITVVPHREFLQADISGQKLFMMLKVRPNQEISNTRPSTSFVFLIDTSGSMNEIVTGDVTPTGRNVRVDGKDYREVKGGKTKMDIVIESLTNLVQSGRLSSGDRVAIVQFDDRASTIIGLTPATEIKSLESAINQLQDFSGGTRMGLGMREAMKILAKENMTSRRTLILTDGQTFDDDDCLDLAQEFASHNIPITALGVGDYSEDLLISLSDTTAGRLFHVDADNNNPTAISIKDLPAKIIEEFSQAQKDVITNLAVTVKTVQGVKLSRIIRVYPEQAEFPITSDPYHLGNAAANDDTIFILEFSVESRAASRVRIAQFGLTYDAPGKNQRGEVPPQNVVVQFVSGQIAVQVDPEVMGYLQQSNINQLLKDAISIADSNPDKAGEILETVRRMTVKIGNKAMEDSVGSVQDELRKTRKISSSSRKTVKMGAKGKTVRMNDDANEGLSDEQIRQISGT